MIIMFFSGINRCLQKVDDSLSSKSELVSSAFLPIAFPPSLFLVERIYSSSPTAMDSIRCGLRRLVPFLNIMSSNVEWASLSTTPYYLLVNSISFGLSIMNIFTYKDDWVKSCVARLPLFPTGSNSLDLILILIVVFGIITPVQGTTAFCRST